MAEVASELEYAELHRIMVLQGLLETYSPTQIDAASRRVLGYPAAFVDMLDEAKKIHECLIAGV